MKLKDIAAGTRAIRSVPLPLCNVPSDLVPDIPELFEQRSKDAASQPGEAPSEVPAPFVGLRVLSGEETVLVYEKARAFAVRRGVEKPTDDDPIYRFGVAVYTCAIACVDPDSDSKNPEPFFGHKERAPGQPWSIESAANEILKSDHLGRDGIAYLAEAHEQWQDLLNPRALKVSPDQLYGLVAKAAAASVDIDDASRFFLGLRPGLQLSLVLFMARLLMSLPGPRSLSGSPSETSTSETSSKPAGADQPS